jgi:predicted nucleic acid-binding protein
VGGRLQAGEREAITLALELGHKALLLDESEAREVARRCGLIPIGMVGLLLKASALGLVSLPEASARLRRTNFRASAELWSRLEGGS